MFIYCEYGGGWTHKMLPSSYFVWLMLGSILNGQPLLVTLNFHFPLHRNLSPTPKLSEGINLSLSSVSTGWSRESVLAEITGK